MAEEKKISDAERITTHVMEDVEKGLDFLSHKLREKREEVEEKGLDKTLSDTVETGKAVSKKTLKEIEESLRELASEVHKAMDDIKE